MAKITATLWEANEKEPRSGLRGSDELFVCVAEIAVPVAVPGQLVDGVESLRKVDL